MATAPPLWTLLPFLGLLTAIAALPLACPPWWHRRYPWVSLAFGAPLTGLLLLQGGDWIPRYAHVLKDYLSFVALLGSLYVISGGVLLRGHLVGTPFVNTALLASGALLANLVGTTGASMLLIRPLLQANRRRQRRAHVVVFFIFLVSNIGGCLTPLGDPPLFLGYLRGVPFEWTLGLAKPWLGMTAALLGIFFLVDYTFFRREKGPAADEAAGLKDPLDLDGWANLALLLCVVAVICLSGRLAWPFGIQEGALATLAAVSWRTTPRRLREANAFSFHPLREVAVLFAGIFATLVPAQAILEGAPVRWPALALTEPWQYFWATGLFSSLLDNAPTYVSFASLASGRDGIASLLASPEGERILAAISLGAVWMGANTYIGNGPNFMVKAIAEEAGVNMPSFLGYLAWSAAVLGPLYLAASWMLWG